MSGSPSTPASDFDPVAFLERAVPVASNEDVGPMRDLLVETLDAHGAAPRVDDAGNVLASRGPDDGDPHLVLNTHADTVSSHVPFERAASPPGVSPPTGADGGERDEDADSAGDVVRGRGSCDAKGPLSALLAAFLAVDPGDARVTLAVTPDEEVLSTGAAALSLDADCYVVGEPTGLDVCTAAKGRFEGTVRLTGVSAHAAEPDSGVNAVAALEQALAALREYDADTESHPQLGAPTLTPTVVRGGDVTNQVPAECEVTVDRRSVPPESQASFERGLEAFLRERLPADVGVAFSLTDRETPFLEAFATDPDHELVRTLADAAAGATGGEGGGVRPFTAATEASYFAPAPVVVFGPGVLADDVGAVAHSDREYVRVESVRQAAEALTDAVASLVT
ncbi:MAG: M20/M25/M40 family metallo-hydrolase [Haloferacaceae archaeon]